MKPTVSYVKIYLNVLHRPKLKVRVRRGVTYPPPPLDLRGNGLVVDTDRAPELVQAVAPTKALLIRGEIQILFPLHQVIISQQAKHSTVLHLSNHRDPSRLQYPPSFGEQREDLDRRILEDLPV